MFYYTNVSFANIYRRPSFHSEVDTQSILWEKLEVSEKIDSFFHICTEDGYDGWINEHQVSFCHEPSEKRALVTALHTHIREHPDPASTSLRHVGAGSRLPVLETKGAWSKILLPDEQTGWIETAAFNSMPELNRKNFVLIAQQFLGTTYVWGGKTPFGLDCSGFVQLLYHLFGKSVRRDAWMQFEDAKPVSENHLKAQPGDLYFFAENGEKITHVGIALGQGKIIHARGLVRINSLHEPDDAFSPQLLKDFVAIRTYF